MALTFVQYFAEGTFLEQTKTLKHLTRNNKPDRATMRPDRVSACIDHVTYMERQMDEQTGETTK